MTTITIKQEGMFPGSPADIYELWMDSNKHAAMTGGEAQISRRVGGEFTNFDGWASGTNVELIPNKKIVQTWRANDWPAGHYSTLTIILVPAAQGTKLMFSQTDVPKNKAKAIAQGWRDYYWGPMKKVLAGE